MTEKTALILVFVGAMLATIGAILAMLALGVRGVGLSLGAIVPLALAADAVARVVMHFGHEEDERRKR